MIGLFSLQVLRSLFSIPENIYVIGTMNTADRSIALMDYALRRRFTFIRLAPEYDALITHLTKHDLPAQSLVNVLRAVNELIGDRNYEIGISFFLQDGENLRSTLPVIWEGEIEPYLEEYFYDDPAKADAFRWKKLIAKELSEWKA